METKICSSCLEVKNCEEFYKKKSGLAGLHAQCKVCLIQKARIRYENDVEKHRQADKEYYLRNKEKKQIKNCEWKTKNPSYFRDYYHRKRKFVDAQKRQEKRVEQYGADSSSTGLNCGGTILSVC